LVDLIFLYHALLLASFLAYCNFLVECKSFGSGYNLIKMGLMFVINQESQRSVSAPNKACTRLVGVGAFSGTLRGLKLVPAK